MKYSSRINHPEHGEMLNLTESAKRLCISKRKFRRIACAPEYLQDGIYPFWSKRVLDLLPVGEDFNQEETLKKGKACGRYLIAKMNDDTIRELRHALVGTQCGGAIRNHTCGIDAQTFGMSLVERAAWCMHNCDCRGTTSEEEIVYRLGEYGINVTFRSNHEAKAFRDGVLSAIKE